MAENQEDRSTEDLSDEPSPYRKEEFRQQGRVAQSRELSAMAALLATAVTTYIMAPRFGHELAQYMREVFSSDLSSKMDIAGNSLLKEYVTKGIKVMIAIGLPVSIAGFLIGAFGSYAQIGSIFSTDPLTPKLEKIDPVQGFKRLLSVRQLVEALRLSLKFAIVGMIVYSIMKSEVLSSSGVFGLEPESLMPVMGQSARVMFLSLFGVLMVFSGFDFFLQRHEYNKSLRLTKQEAKQEFKEREGNPQIRARIRAVQREISRKRMMTAVKKADVIVTNPTHIAVALVYDTDNMNAPKVVAKGADFLAQKIKKVASDAGIPLVENVQLARTLYKSVKIGQSIPRNLYQAVAEVLAYVYRLKGKTMRGGR